MAHIADPNSRLGRLCEIVDSLKPGECCRVTRHELADIPSFDHNDATFTPADRILGNIIGSAYTHSFEQRLDGDVVFTRHEDTGERRYKEPDHNIRVARLAERGLTKW